MIPLFRRLRRILLVTVLAGVVACQSMVSRSCEGPPRRLDHWTSLLTDADLTNRLVAEVSRAGTHTKTTIDDPSKVRTAVAFLKRHSDGWRESWNARAGGHLNLYLYDEDRLIGIYSLTEAEPQSATSLVSVGSLTQRVDRLEVEALLQSLNLHWPR